MQEKFGTSLRYELCPFEFEFESESRKAYKTKRFEDEIFLKKELMTTKVEVL
jgi:hypothetical protein